MALVQITKREGFIDRVPSGQTPVIELDLESHQYVSSVDLKETWVTNLERKTTDWRYTVYVVTPLGEAVS